MNPLTQAALTAVRELWTKVSDIDDTSSTASEHSQPLWELVANTCDAYSIQHEYVDDRDAVAMFTWLGDIALIRGSMSETSRDLQAATPKLAIVQSMDQVLR